MCYIISDKVAFRSPQWGSFLIYFLQSEENIELLAKETGLLTYLTKVASDVAQFESNHPWYPEAKMTATIVHCLTGDVVFKPVTRNSRFQKLVQYFQKKLALASM